MRRRYGPLSFAALALLLIAPAAASTYVRVPDAALVDQAAVVALVTVAAVEPPAVDAADLFTTYRLTVVRSLKGSAAKEIALRVPGGVRADGVAGVLWGAPTFARGERLLLFLAPRPDGSYALLHLLLGAFHVAETRSGTTVALRSFAGGTELPRLGGTSEEGRADDDRPRDVTRFATWIADRAAGRSRDASYFVAVAPSDLADLREKFTLFVDQGLNMRWFEFDAGRSVPFYAHESGQPGLAGGGFAEIQTALAAWDADPGSSIFLTYAGTTATEGSLSTPNGLNEITFDDPFHELTPFDCQTGGFLAYTFTYANAAAPRLWKGVPYAPITGSHVITNKNITCSLNSVAEPSTVAAALFTHELGHSLGLGHSCGDAESPPCASDPVLADAIMNAIIHYDGRGAELTADDQKALRLLYSPQVGRTGCVPDPHTLCLDRGRFALTVSWTNQFDGSSGQGRPVLGSDQAGFFSFGDPANVELLIKVLDFPEATKVFYGELTNLHFTLLVTDTLLHQTRTYSNTAGDCGGLDAAAFSPLPPGRKKTPRLAACRADRTTLCLLGGRFAVTVDWANPGNATAGSGQTHRLSDLVGTFSFTDPANLELMTKVIQASDRIELFWGALSDLPYTIHVTDTATGARKSYQSQAGKVCGGLDNQAF